MSDKIILGMSQVQALVLQPGNYYNAFPEQKNEVLLKIAQGLSTYCNALEYLVNTPAFGENEIKQLIDILKDVDPNEETVLRKSLQMNGKN